MPIFPVVQNLGTNGEVFTPPVFTKASTCFDEENEDVNTSDSNNLFLWLKEKHL